MPESMRIYSIIQRYIIKHLYCVEYTGIWRKVYAFIPRQKLLLQSNGLQSLSDNEFQAVRYGSYPQQPRPDGRMYFVETKKSVIISFTLVGYFIERIKDCLWLASSELYTRSLLPLYHLYQAQLAL